MDDGGRKCGLLNEGSEAGCRVHSVLRGPWAPCSGQEGSESYHTIATRHFISGRFARLPAQVTAIDQEQDSSSASVIDQPINERNRCERFAGTRGHLDQSLHSKVFLLEKPIQYKIHVNPPKQ
jgi:hypothetical protein